MSNVLIFIAQLTAITGICWVALKLLRPLSAGVSQRLISICFILCLMLPLVGLLPISINLQQLMQPKQSLHEAAVQDWNDVYWAKTPAIMVQPMDQTNPVVTVSEKGPTGLTKIEKKPFSWAGLLMWFWLVGMLFNLLYRGQQMVRIQGIIRRGQPLHSVAGVDPGKVRLLTSSEADVPFLFVAWRAYVILPNAVMQADAQHVQHIIKHELCHYRRRDHWGMWLAIATSCVYWFHPLIRHLRAQQKQYMEQACDAQMLAEGANRYGYAETLVLVAKNTFNNPLVVQMADEPKLLKSRIHAIVNKKTMRLRASHKAWLVVCLMLVVGAGCIDPRAQALLNASEVVQLVSQDFDSFRTSELPKGHIYMTVFYDGVANENAFAELELETQYGQRAWLTLGPLKKFNEVVHTWHFKLLNKTELTGNYRISGVEPDGVVDGVAMGLLLSDHDGKISIHKTKTEIVSGETPNVMCAWPLKVEPNLLMDMMPQLTVHNPESAELMLCGSMLMGNGEYRLQ